MSKVKVAAFSISLDGFGTGPGQDLKNPLGVRGLELHSWLFPNGDFSEDDRKKVADRWASTTIMLHSLLKMWAPGSWVAICLDRFAVHGKTIPGKVGGATIRRTIRRSLCSRITRGPPLRWKGARRFHFVTDGPEAALARARDAAKGKDIRIGGGVSVLRQFLGMNLIDEMHLAVSPVLLGEGEHLFGGLDLPRLGYVHCKTAPGDGALHVFIRNM